jgi:hypothetical protein
MLNTFEMGKDIADVRKRTESLLDMVKELTKIVTLQGERIEELSQRLEKNEDTVGRIEIRREAEEERANCGLS